MFYSKIRTSVTVRTNILLPVLHFAFPHCAMKMKGREPLPISAPSLICTSPLHTTWDQCCGSPCARTIGEGALLLEFADPLAHFTSVTILGGLPHFCFVVSLLLLSYYLHRVANSCGESSARFERSEDKRRLPIYGLKSSIPRKISYDHCAPFLAPFSRRT